MSCMQSSKRTGQGVLWSRGQQPRAHGPDLVNQAVGSMKTQCMWQFSSEWRVGNIIGRRSSGSAAYRELH